MGTFFTMRLMPRKNTDMLFGNDDACLVVYKSNAEYIGAVHKQFNIRL